MFFCPFLKENGLSVLTNFGNYFWGFALFLFLEGDYDTGSEDGTSDGELQHRPTHAPGRAKYCGFRSGGVGLFTARSFPSLATLSPRLCEVLVQASNNSLSQNTWKQYTSVRKHLERCQKFTNIRFSFPFTQDQVLLLISYLFTERNLKSVSVSKILSGLRTIHLVEGHPVPSLRPAVVTMVLRGKSNWDEEEARSLPQRLPVTLKMLKLLEITLKLDTSRTRKDKSLIWAVALIAFNGGFRSGFI